MNDTFVTNTTESSVSFGERGGSPGRKSNKDSINQTQPKKSRRIKHLKDDNDQALPLNFKDQKTKSSKNVEEDNSNVPMTSMVAAKKR